MTQYKSCLLQVMATRPQCPEIQRVQDSLIDMKLPSNCHSFNVTDFLNLPLSVSLAEEFLQLRGECQ